VPDASRKAQAASSASPRVRAGRRFFMSEEISSA
jgi:hypothetical protein